MGSRPSGGEVVSGTLSPSPNGHADSYTTGWKQVTASEPCDGCGKGDWCSRSADGQTVNCRRALNGTPTAAGWRSVGNRIDRSGAQTHIFTCRPASTKATATPSIVERFGRAPVADAEVRDEVFSAMFAALPTARDFGNRRGLTAKQTEELGYGIFGQNRAAAVRRLIEAGMEPHFPSIPGLYLKGEADRRYWSFAGAGGTAIPVRDKEGRIIAAKIRKGDDDASKAFPKYTSLSSQKHGGCGAEASLHWALEKSATDPTSIRVTEGEVKADFATVATGVRTVSIPGVGMWKLAAEAVQSGSYNRVLIAFDADWRTNQIVAKSMLNLICELRAWAAQAGVEIVVETWAADVAKGIDDLLRTGKRPTEVRLESDEGEAILSQLEIVANGRRLRTTDITKVIIDTDEMRVNDQVYEHIKTIDGLYVYGGFISEVGFDELLGTSKIRTVTKPRLREIIADAVTLVRISTTKDGDLVEQDAHPPDWCTEALLARGDYPGMKVLYGALDFPVLTPSGRILRTEGYDEEAKLFLSRAAVVEIETPADPTQEDAKQAVEILLDPLQDFPIDDKMKSAFIAAMLGIVARPAYKDACPALLVTAPTPGSGKGLLVSLLARIVVGRSIGIETLNPDPKQQKTQFTSIVKDGQRIVNFDNLPPSLRSPILDGFITSGGATWKDRVYFSQSNGEWPNDTCVILNGNNIEAHEDTSRRCNYVRLETTCERPEDRTGFKYPNLLQHADEKRPKLLGALFTILRAYIAAGRPKMPTAAWGSFEGFRTLVANSCVFAGLPDPTSTKKILQNQSGNPLQAFGTVLRGLKAAAPIMGLTGKEFLEILNPKDEKGRPESPPTFGDIDATDIMAALEALTNGDPTTKAVGYLFRKYEGRIVNGLRLVRGDRSGSGCRFAVEALVSADDADDVDAKPKAGNDTENQRYSPISLNSGVNSPLGIPSASSSTSTRLVAEDSLKTTANAAALKIALDRSPFPMTAVALAAAVRLPAPYVDGLLGWMTGKGIVAPHQNCVGVVYAVPEKHGSDPTAWTAIPSPAPVVAAAQTEIDF